jgi:hypothetical protein
MGESLGGRIVGMPLTLVHDVGSSSSLTRSQTMMIIESITRVKRLDLPLKLLISKPSTPTRDLILLWIKMESRLRR